MQWLRLLVMRWLKIPVTVDIKRFVFKGEPVTSFGPEHYENWAKLWQLAPGLYDSWYMALGETIKSMAATPANEAHHGERIRLCQRAVDLWQNLQLANNAEKSLNAHWAEVQAAQESGNRGVNTSQIL